MQRTMVDERYSILGFLGSGGMGHVYLAHDEVLERDVALKILRESYAQSEEFVERFRREARNAARLYHPNIVSVYDKGETEDGTPYIAMEHVAGGTLGERIAREGVLDASEAVAMTIQIALALEAAHRCGVVHRDVKPHNVFLARSPASPSAALEGVPSGEVKVGDFGVARAAEATTLTDEGQIFGTASYLSPEQVKGERVGQKSDLYSLGVILYEMLTGRVPFDGEDPMATAAKHVSEPPPSPKEANPEVPAVVDAVVLRLLSKYPKDRHEDAAELIGDLRRIWAGLPAGLQSAEPPKVIASLARTRGVSSAISRGPHGKPLHLGNERTEAFPLRAAVIYGRGPELRRAFRRALPIASVAIVAMLGAIGWNLTQGYAEPDSVTQAQDVALVPTDALPPETPEENLPKSGGPGGADEGGTTRDTVPSSGDAVELTALGTQGYVTPPAPKETPAAPNKEASTPSSQAASAASTPASTKSQEAPAASQEAPAAPQRIPRSSTTKANPSTPSSQKPSLRTVVGAEINREATTGTKQFSSTTKAESR
jgi:eukaryotic-like serine/threonine-protein kinase